MLLVYFFVHKIYYFLSFFSLFAKSLSSQTTLNETILQLFGMLIIKKPCWDKEFAGEDRSRLNILLIDALPDCLYDLSV